VLGVANGQRVPEDWHRLSAKALVQRAMTNSSGPAWRLDEHDVSLVFAGAPLPPAAGATAPALHA
jgi:flagellar biosynthesis protein FlhF